MRRASWSEKGWPPIVTAVYYDAFLHFNVRLLVVMTTEKEEIRWPLVVSPMYLIIFESQS